MHNFFPKSKVKKLLQKTSQMNLKIRPQSWASQRSLLNLLQILYRYICLPSNIHILNDLKVFVNRKPKDFWDQTHKNCYSEYLNEYI